MLSVTEVGDLGGLYIKSHPLCILQLKKTNFAPLSIKVSNLSDEEH